MPALALIFVESKVIVFESPTRLIPFGLVAVEASAAAFCMVRVLPEPETLIIGERSLPDISHDLARLLLDPLTLRPVPLNPSATRVGFAAPVIVLLLPLISIKEAFRNRVAGPLGSYWNLAASAKVIVLPVPLNCRVLLRKIVCPDD